MPAVESCLTCKHIDKKSFNKCKAFPKGIPFIIASGGFEHTKSIAGDNGIVYELDPDTLIKKSD